MPEAEVNPFPELPPTSPSRTSPQMGVPDDGFSSETSNPPSSGSTNQTTSIVSPNLSPGKGSRGNMTLTDTSPHDASRTPPRNQSMMSSGAWSTLATPGLADEDEGRYFDLKPSAPPLTPPVARSQSADRRNVRFMGPDGAPLSPATTHITVDSYEAPPGPPPSTFASSSTSSPSPAPPSPPAKDKRPRVDSSAFKDDVRPPVAGNDRHGPVRSSSTIGGINARPRGDSDSRVNGTSASPFPPSVAVPPPPPPSLVSYPSQPPHSVTPYGLGLTAPPHSAAPTRKQIDQTQKHAKWAISALDFDDIETARSELRKALETIGG